MAKKRELGDGGDIIGVPPDAQELPPASALQLTRTVTDAALSFGDVVLVHLRRARDLVRGRVFKDTADPYVCLSVAEPNDNSGGASARFASLSLFFLLRIFSSWSSTGVLCKCAVPKDTSRD